MDKELAELHELYGKHDPIWIATIFGPKSHEGRQLVCAVGMCACRSGCYTSLTQYAPIEEEIHWEHAPVEMDIVVNEQWRGPFETVMRHNAGMSEAYDTYKNNRVEAMKKYETPSH